MAESEHYNGRYSTSMPSGGAGGWRGKRDCCERVDCSWDEYITNKSSALFTSHTHRIENQISYKNGHNMIFPRKKGERRWLCWLSQCWRGTRGRYKVASLHHTKLSSQLFLISLSPTQFRCYLTWHNILWVRMKILPIAFAFVIVFWRPIVVKSSNLIAWIGMTIFRGESSFIGDAIRKYHLKEHT